MTERLAAQFITESLQDRTVQADQTSQFLETQLEEARRKLAEHEQTVRTVPQKYSGELPSQVASTLAVMQSTQTQLQSLADAINRDRDRQLVLDKRWRIWWRLARPTREPHAPGAPAERPTAAEQLEQARAALRSLQQRLKPEHPDVVRAERVVRELEEKAAAEELNAPVGTGVGRPCELGGR